MTTIALAKASAKSDAGTGILRMRIEEELKGQAETVLRDMGLDVSDAVKVFLRRVVAERRMPFEIYAVSTPMELTRQAVARSRSAILKTEGRMTSKEIFDELEGGAEVRQ